MEPNKLGPMDKFVHPIDGKSNKEEALRQLSMNEALFKERVHQVSQYVARWVYTHGKLSWSHLFACSLALYVAISFVSHINT